MNLDATFKALADATRREIIYLLSVTPDGMGINAISEQFHISRQGVSKHIGILENAGILQLRSEGREKICHLNPLPLKSVMDWLEFYQAHWAERLNNLNND